MSVNNNNEVILPDEVIVKKIHYIRGKRVILASDLADLYQVETKRLNEQVRRNAKRFPEHFMFQLSKEEKEEVVANCDHLFKLKYSPYLPFAFTEYGIVMLASILNSERAISVSIRITEIFIRMFEMLQAHKELLQKLGEVETKIDHHDNKFQVIFEYLKQLEQSKQNERNQKNRKKIGYKNYE